MFGTFEILLILFTTVVLLIADYVWYRISDQRMHNINYRYYTNRIGVLDFKQRVSAAVLECLQQGTGPAAQYLPVPVAVPGVAGPPVYTADQRNEAALKYVCHEVNTFGNQIC